MSETSSIAARKAAATMTLSSLVDHSHHQRSPHPVPELIPKQKGSLPCVVLWFDGTSLIAVSLRGYQSGENPRR